MTSYILNNETIPAFLVILPITAINVVVCVAFGRLKRRSWLLCAFLGLIPFLGPIYVFTLDDRAGVTSMSPRKDAVFFGMVYFVVPLIAGGEILLWEYAVAEVRQSVYARIIQDVSPSISRCESVPLTVITVRGKVLIWDLSKGSMATIHGMLPPDVRARGSENELTIFFFGERHRIDSGREYMQKGWPQIDGHPLGLTATAYDASMDVYVIYWPTGTPVGKFTARKNAPDEVEVSWPNILPSDDIAIDQIELAALRDIRGILDEKQGVK